MSRLVATHIKLLLSVLLVEQQQNMSFIKLSWKPVKHLDTMAVAYKETSILDVTAIHNFGLFGPTWSLVRGIERTQNLTDHTPCLNGWTVKGQIALIFFQRSLLAVRIPNANWSQKVSVMRDPLSQKWSQMAFLSIILCLPFSRNLEAWIIWQLGLTFSPASIHLLLIPFSYFFTISHHMPLLSCELFHSDVQSNFLIVLSLFCFLTSRGGENLKVLLAFVQSSFSLFLISECGLLQTLWHFLKISQGLSFSDLSELKPLWTPTSPQLQKILVL